MYTGITSIIRFYRLSKDRFMYSYNRFFGEISSHKLFKSSSYSLLVAFLYLSAFCLMPAKTFSQNKDLIQLVYTDGTAVEPIDAKKCFDRETPCLLKVHKSVDHQTVNALSKISKNAFGRVYLKVERLRSKRSDYTLIRTQAFVHEVKKYSKNYVFKPGKPLKLKVGVDPVNLEKVLVFLQTLLKNGNITVMEFLNLFVLFLSGAVQINFDAFPGVFPPGTGTPSGTGTNTPTPTVTPTVTPVPNQNARTGWCAAKSESFFAPQFLPKVSCAPVPCPNKPGTIGQPGGCQKPHWNRTYGASAACCSGQSTNVRRDYVGQGCGTCNRGDSGCIGLWECTSPVS